MYKIILASGSPRRKEILEQVGVKFEVITSDCNENIGVYLPDELVKSLSRLKAETVAENIEGEAVIIGADTVVSKDGLIFGKPGTIEHAKEMIESISGDTHSVFTGVCIIIKSHDIKRNRIINFVEETKVCVAQMSEEEINNYVSTQEPYDKAGGYAVQGLFAPYILGISGDYYNIVGLPVARIYHELKMEGIDILHG